MAAAVAVEVIATVCWDLVIIFGTGARLLAATSFITMLGPARSRALVRVLGIGAIYLAATSFIITVSAAGCWGLVVNAAATEFITICLPPHRADNGSQARGSGALPIMQTELPPLLLLLRLCISTQMRTVDGRYASKTPSSRLRGFG
jgi:energy-converting hydrogenase Eha subunit E